MYNKDISYSMLVVITDKGKASKILADCKKTGVHGGTIIYGSGTANGGLLHLLELYEIKKEILSDETKKLIRYYVPKGQIWIGNKK